SDVGVTSVNGKDGDVVLDASDVGALPASLSNAIEYDEGTGNISLVQGDVKVGILNGVPTIQVEDETLIQFSGEGILGLSGDVNIGSEPELESTTPTHRALISINGQDYWLPLELIED